MSLISKKKIQRKYGPYYIGVFLDKICLNYVRKSAIFIKLN